LSVPAGQVFGRVGETGAGKTTMIKHILGLLKVQSGRVRVFGRDPVVDPVGVLSRIGYLSEQRDLPGWMSIAELLRYTQAWYPTWDQTHADELLDKFKLDPAQKCNTLSQGQRAKTGLTLALAQRPDLLILDEPSSGLDPLVRRDILEAILRGEAVQGRTVLFSSHLLDEIESVSDKVAMMHQGEIVLCRSLAEIKQSHYRLTIRLAKALSGKPDIPGAFLIEGSGKDWTAVVDGEPGQAQAYLARIDGQIQRADRLSLDEVFIARVGRRIRGI
jgi:ABC-2 type transport system ATP-binding protein